MKKGPRQDSNLDPDLSGLEYSDTWESLPEFHFNPKVLLIAKSSQQNISKSLKVFWTKMEICDF